MSSMTKINLPKLPTIKQCYYKKHEIPNLFKCSKNQNISKAFAMFPEDHWIALFVLWDRHIHIYTRKHVKIENNVRTYDGVGWKPQFLYVSMQNKFRCRGVSTQRKQHIHVYIKALNNRITELQRTHPMTNYNIQIRL